MRLLGFFAAFVISTAAWGQVTPTTASGPLRVGNAGTTVARRPVVNFAGTTTCVDNPGANRTDCTSTGGGGNAVAVTVDFGATGTTNAQTVVTGQAWVTATSIIVCAPTAVLVNANYRPEGAEDAVIEGLTSAISARAIGTGFTLQVAAQVGKAYHAFVFHCIGV